MTETQVLPWSGEVTGGTGLGGGREDFLGEGFLMSVGLVLDIGDRVETETGTCAADEQARESILLEGTSLAMETCLNAGTVEEIRRLEDCELAVISVLAVVDNDLEFR